MHYSNTLEFARRQDDADPLRCWRDEFHHPVIDGRRVLNMCSNNYLGLAADPALVDAATRAMQRYGVGPGAVRTIAGWSRYCKPPKE